MLLTVVVIIANVFIIMGIPPVVFIGGELHFVISKELHLSNDEFSNKDVKALRHLKSLEKFEMYGTKITDISFLDNMGNLKEFDLLCNPEWQITDFKPLSNCKKLELFRGCNLGISDLSAFKELTNLKRLYVEALHVYNRANIDSNINDISDIKYLVNLEAFAIVGNNISDISALKYCTKLESVALYGVTATDHSALFELPNLKRIYTDEYVLTKDEIRELEAKGVYVYEYEQSNGTP